MEPTNADVKMATLTKNELAAKIAQHTGMTLGLARTTVKITLDEIQSALVGGRNVEFRGFGVMRPTLHKPRKGRNPRNIAAGVYAIPERMVIKFKVGIDLDKALNQHLSATP